MALLLPNTSPDPEAECPIATGVIEGAVLHIVADRLDTDGARRGLERAEAVLRLRIVVANGHFPATGATTSTRNTTAFTQTTSTSTT